MAFLLNRAINRNGSVEQEMLKKEIEVKIESEKQ